MTSRGEVLPEQSLIPGTIIYQAPSRSVSVESVALDEVIDVRARKIETLRRFGNVPAGRLERLLQELTLEAVRLLLKAQLVLPGRVVGRGFELEVRRLDLQEGLPCRA